MGQTTEQTSTEVPEVGLVDTYTFHCLHCGHAEDVDASEQPTHCYPHCDHLLDDYERATSWVPTEEWLDWAETFDARIGFREDDRSWQEQDARAYAAVQPHHRGAAGNLSGEASIDQPWTVSTDVVTKTPRQCEPVRRFVRDTDERVAEAREAMALRAVQVRHTNRTTTPRMSRAEVADARSEALEIRRVLAEYGEPEEWRDDAPIWRAPTPA